MYLPRKRIICSSVGMSNLTRLSTRASKAEPPHQSQIWSHWVIDSASTLSWPDARVQKVFWHRWNWSLHASFSPWMKARPCTNKLIGYVTHMTYISCSKEKKADRAATVSGGLKLLSAFSVSSAKWNLLHSECSKPSPGHLHLAHLDTLWHLHFQVLPGWKEYCSSEAQVQVWTHRFAAWEECYGLPYPSFCSGNAWSCLACVQTSWPFPGSKVESRLTKTLGSLLFGWSPEHLIPSWNPRHFSKMPAPLLFVSNKLQSNSNHFLFTSTLDQQSRAWHYLSRLNPSGAVPKMLYTGIRYTSKWPLQ